MLYTRYYICPFNDQFIKKTKKNLSIRICYFFCVIWDDCKGSSLLVELSWKSLLALRPRVFFVAVVLNLGDTFLMAEYLNLGATDKQIISYPYDSHHK